MVITTVFKRLEGEQRGVPSPYLFLSLEPGAVVRGEDVRLEGFGAYVNHSVLMLVSLIGTAHGGVELTLGVTCDGTACPAAAQAVPPLCDSLKDVLSVHNDAYLIQYMISSLMSVKYIS